ncbi:putative aspartate transaminase [Helianthus annuus]|uniref:Aspartate transaminase n=1 Tax=Helianthus annuus TaxID=4232 RepID=A0A9K3I208_HELAN|nr:putative aspartate transaminase [Helianthus annuus]
MFTFTGLNADQVAFMTKEYHIYMTSDGCHACCCNRYAVNQYLVKSSNSFHFRFPCKRGMFIFDLYLENYVQYYLY